MCTVLLPPGVNPIAVNKYINIKNIDHWFRNLGFPTRQLFRFGLWRLPILWRY